MRRIYLLLLISVIFFGCNSDQDLFEIVQSYEEEGTPDPEESPDEDSSDETSEPDMDSPPPVDYEGQLDINNTPCDYGLDVLEENGTLAIDCTIDLGGQTINIPSGATLEYNGGQIINGTLNFGGGYIDGNLMNKDLTLTGQVALTSEIFQFHPNRWDIVQGEVNDVTARKNRDEFEGLFLITKDLGANEFVVDQFDAFFKIDDPTEIIVPQISAINLPSDYILTMSANTHLRMQPHAFKRGALLAVTDNASNVVIRGGNLHGERDEHDYTSDPETEHGWNHLIVLKGCHDVIVENVVLMNAAGDGINVSGLNHAFSPEYNPTNNAIIRNNTFIRNRRLHISVTSAYDVLVENNEFIDAGVHTMNSQGTAPSFAVDVEAVRGADGTIYEIAEDIIIRNNTERGSRIGGITVHTGDRVTIEGNHMESSISYSTTIGTIIRNNVLTATTDFSKSNGTAITAGRNDRYERNYNNSIYGNSISGFSTGILIANIELEIYSNEIVNCKNGMALQSLKTSNIFENIIESNREGSDGIVMHPSSEFLNAVDINNNSISVERTAFYFVGTNYEVIQENNLFTIRNNNVIRGGTTVSNSNGFVFTENTLNDGIRLVNAISGEITNNSISTSSSHGVRLDAGNSNIAIRDNTIEVTGNYNCIQENASGENIVITGNSCQ